MTEPKATRPTSLDAVFDHPRVVLDDDGLDLLELVIEGWLPVTTLDRLTRPEGATLLLTDAENSPLAELDQSADPMVLTVLRPAWRGAGPHWEPASRLAAADLATLLASSDDASGKVAAYVVDDAPTRADVTAALDDAAGAAAVVVVVPVGRREPVVRALGWTGLTHAAWELADLLETADPARTVIRLALPWPKPAPGDIAAPLTQQGIDRVVVVRERRLDLETERIVGLPDAFLREAEQIYLPATAREVVRAHARVEGQGAVVFFTGLSGSGKSTVARALAHHLAALGDRTVTLLDGDEVRQHLSKGLGFDAESRATNIDRIAWVAALVASHGGIAVAAPIAPFDAGRRAARVMATRSGADFVLVHMSTPLEVCEARDRKGLYAKARRGEVLEFTGISSPYEVPTDADLTIDTTHLDIAAALSSVMATLESRAT